MTPKRQWYGHVSRVYPRCNVFAPDAGTKEMRKSNAEDTKMEKEAC